MAFESKEEEEKGGDDTAANKRSRNNENTDEKDRNVNVSEESNQIEAVQDKNCDQESEARRPLLSRQFSSGPKVQFVKSDEEDSDADSHADVKDISIVKTSPRRRLDSGSSYAKALKNQRHRTISENSSVSTRKRLGSIGSNSLSRASFSSSTSSSSSSSSSNDSLTTTTYSFTAPDGGWGWVIVAASFIVNMIADGVTFSFGILFVELQKEFQESKAYTAGVVSLFHAVPLLSGPIASALADRYGCRRITIVGALLSALGFFLSSFCNHLEFLFFTFGLLAGFGLSLCYVAAIVIVAYYFDRKRSFATGISLCGSGVGTFVFAPLTSIFIEHFGWRGATLCLSLFFLSMIACGCVFRDLSIKKHISRRRKKRKARSRSRSISFGKRASVGSISTNSMPKIGEIREILEKGDIASLFGQNDWKEYQNVSSSLVNIPTYISNGEKIPAELQDALSKNRRMYKALYHRYPEAFDLEEEDNNDAALENGKPSEADKLPNELVPTTEVLNESIEVKLQRKVSSLFKKRPSKSILKRSTYTAPENLEDVNLNLEETEVHNAKKITPHSPSSVISPQSTQTDEKKVNQGNLPSNQSFPYRCESPTSNISCSTTMNLRHLKLRRQSLTYRGAMLNINRYRIRASSCPDIYKNSTLTLHQEENESSDLRLCFEDMLDCFGQCSHAELFNLRFVLFCFSNFILYAWYDVMYVYLVDYAERDLKFLPSDATFLLSILGILNTFGEIIIGYFGDRSYINTNYLYAACMLACGLSTAMVPVISSYGILSTLAGIYGIAIAANYSLTSPILVDLVSLEQFSSAYGFLLLVQGISNLVGPPLAGLMYDQSGEWFLTFGVSGGFIVLSGALLLILPCLKSIRKRKISRIRSDGMPLENDQPTTVI